MTEKPNKGHSLRTSGDQSEQSAGLETHPSEVRHPGVTRQEPKGGEPRFENWLLRLQRSTTGPTPQE